MNTITSNIYRALALTGLLTSSAYAQQTLLTYHVEQHIDAREWTLAQNKLSQLRTTHPKKDDQAKILFTYGYLYQVMATDDTAQHKRWLDSATTYYRRVTKAHTKYPAALRNLALIYDGQGQPRAAISSLRRAITQTDDPTYSVTLGDFYLRQSQYDSAYYFYKKSLDQDASLRAAHERMAYLYNVKTVDNESIFNHCQQMVDQGLPELASTTMTDLIRRSYADSLSFDNVRALVWWMSLFGKKKTASDDFLQAMPTAWRNPVYLQLVDAWRDPIKIKTLDWWRKSDSVAVSKTLRVEPRAAVTDALVVRGQQLIREGKRAEGIAVYEAAYQFITDGDPQHLLSRRQIPDAFFNVASNLGLAYTKYLELDPDERKFKRLEDDLFYGKNTWYMQGGNPTAIVKFHTTLGLIYASKDQWQGGVTSGIFQLERAIKGSPDSKNTITLKRLLVKGYLATNEQKKAQSMLLSCAVTYMNDDNLNSAQQCFIQYDSLRGNRQAKDYVQLKNVLSFRNRLAKLTPSDLDGMDRLEKSIDSLSRDTTVLPSYFYKIQRFKILSDLGDKAHQLSNEKAATYFHVRALDQARKVETLSNLRDVSRINAQQNTIEKTVPFGNRPGKALPKLKVGSTKEQYKWNLPQPGAKDDLEVKINNDAFVASRLAEMLNNSSTNAGDQKSKVMIDGATKEVLILPATVDTPTRDLQKEVKKTIKTEDAKMKVRTVKP